MTEEKVVPLTKVESMLLSKELKYIEDTNESGECMVTYKVNLKTVSIRVEHASGQDDDNFDLDRETMERI